MSELDNDGNICFFLDEKDEDKNNEDEIQKMLDEFSDLTESEFGDNHNDNNDNILGTEYFSKNCNYGNDETYYTKECTIKDLLKICSYYGIDKDIKTSKCKKQDIISTLVYFESLPENFEIVQKRNRMWAYIIELLNDTKMKKYIIWN